MKRLAQFKITYPLLRELLLLPANCDIVQIKHDPTCPDRGVIFVASKDFPELPEGGEPVEVCPSFENIDGKAWFVDWNLPRDQ